MYVNQLLKHGNNNIDIFRLVAALMVIYGHAPAFVPNTGGGDLVARLLGFDYSGSLAVKFFFMLSGLLVTNSLMSRAHLIEFLIKRSARIFPGLIVCLSITAFVVGPLFTTLSVAEYFAQPQTWKYFFHNSILTNLEWFLPGVFADSKHGVNGSLWTLPLEFICYLFLGAFFAIGLWRQLWFSTVLLIAIIALSFFTPNFLPPVFANNKESNMLAGCFALGALFATHKAQIKITLQGVLALAVLAFLLWSTSLNMLMFYVFAFYSCLYLSATSFFIKRLNMGADPSYGIYIYGFVIQQCLAYLLPGHSLLFNQLFAGFIALGVGLMSWFLIEKPSINLIKKTIAMPVAQRLLEKLV